MRFEYAVSSFEYIKVCLRHDLSTHEEISATCNMKLRLVIKFPTPMRGDQMPCLQED